MVPKSASRVLPLRQSGDAAHGETCGALEVDQRSRGSLTPPKLITNSAVTSQGP